MSNCLCKEFDHLFAVTDALNTTATLERKPDGEVLRINHPDGVARCFRTPTAKAR